MRRGHATTRDTHVHRRTRRHARPDGERLRHQEPLGRGRQDHQNRSLVPAHGPLASFGIPERAGADAYFKSVNARGGINGRTIDWVVKDNANDPQQTVQIARRLVDQDGVVAIVATNGTSQTQATFPFVLEQKKVPVLNTLGGDASWYEPARDGLFGLQTLYEDQAAALGDWVTRDGAKKVLVVHSDPAAFVNVARVIGPAARKTDPSVQVKRLSVKYQTTDYSPVISKVKAAKPDAVVLILTAAETASYLKEARLQGVTAPCTATRPWRHRPRSRWGPGDRRPQGAPAGQVAERRRPGHQGVPYGDAEVRAGASG